jgi:proteasome accessory factor B
MADRVERLTNLLALLLETPEPLSLVQIGAELAGQYPEAHQARRAAFERDKSALRGIGVPIETSIVDGGPYAGQTRYRIDRAAYELADLDLEPDEMRALQVAVAAVRTGTTLGRDALLKLGGEVVDRAPPISVQLADRPELPVIRAAIAARSPITFSYRGESRTVDPWGVLLRGGFWYVIGHDHARAAQRTFRVDRIDGSISAGTAGSFERPTDFDPRAAFPADPKEIGHGSDGGVDATVWISPVRARAVEREVGAERVSTRRDDGAIEVVVPATNLDAFRSWVLGLLDHAVVLGPPAVRDHVRAWLRSVAEGTA